MDQNKSKVYYPWLDLIRFLAAFAVLAVHTRGMAFETYSHLTPESQNLFTKIFFLIFSGGQIGVVTFFVLSGFLVGGRTIDKIRGGTADIRKFAVDRAVRIGVPLFGSLILVFLVNELLGRQNQWYDFIGNLFGFQGLYGIPDIGGVFWTLTYETWFYVLIGSLILLFSAKNRMKNEKIYGVVLLSTPCFIYANIETYWTIMLLLGIVGYNISKKSCFLDKKRLVVLLILLFVIYFMECLGFPSNAHEENLFSKVGTNGFNVACGVIMMLIISGVIHLQPKTKKAKFVESWGRKMASFSFSLYLTHWQVLRIFEHYVGKSNEVDIASIAYFFSYLIVCIIVAYAFYWLFERNTKKINDWLWMKFFRNSTE